MSVRLLLAVDHTLVRQALGSFLGVSPRLQLIGQASTGREAWEMIQRLQPQVTVLDIGMSGLNGLEIARKNARSGFRNRIVMLGACSDARLFAESIEAGAKGFVAKDCSLDDLVSAINTVMDGKTYVSSTLSSALRRGLRRGDRTTGVLSVREREVLTMIAEGKSSREIAVACGISPRTVDTHRTHLAKKLGVETLAEMVRYAVRVGLVAWPMSLFAPIDVFTVGEVLEVHDTTKTCVDGSERYQRTRRWSADVYRRIL